MTDRSEWPVARGRTLTFGGGRVGELEIRVAGGAVNVVGTGEDAARVEITEVDGPPLIVRHEGGRLTVAYEDLPGKGFLTWLEREGRRRRAVVSVSVPAAIRLTVGVVSASAVISGIAGRAAVSGVRGGTTLVGLSGEVRADTVSGDVEAQGLSGPLRFHSVSGGLTVVESRTPRVAGDSVSGDMVVDFAPEARAVEARLGSVSGGIALRLPGRVSARVSAGTTSGAVSSAFPELAVTRGWGAGQLAGTLGAGDGVIRCTTVSGAIAMLRRPPAEYGTSAASSLRKDV
jgi:hypothetical protein